MPSADVIGLLTGIEDLAGSLRDGMAHVSSMENAGAVAARVLDESYREQALRESGEISRVFFGLHDLDAMTGGLYKEELTVIAGRPLHGKIGSGFVDGTPSGAAGMAVAYFSVEMSKEQNVMRLLSMISGVNADSLRFKGTSVSDRARLEEAKKRTGAVTAHAGEYCGSDTIEDMRAKAQSLHKKGWLGVLYIDYLNLINIIVSKMIYRRRQILPWGTIARKGEN